MFQVGFVFNNAISTSPNWQKYSLKNKLFPVGFVFKSAQLTEIFPEKQNMFKLFQLYAKKTLEQQ